MTKRSKQKVLLQLLQFFAIVFAVSSGCSQIQVPAIDPTGNRIFLPSPYSTSVLPFGQSANPNAIPYGAQARQTGPIAGLPTSNYPALPAFQHPAPVPSCTQASTGTQGCQLRKHIIPKACSIRKRGQSGEIIMTPRRIIAPVGSEVVVLAGVCGGDGYYALNQPLEWMLSNNSVGQLIEVGGRDHAMINRLLPPSASKKDGQYAHGRTCLKPQIINRGTPTPVDDIDLSRGQTYVSLSSASPGTTYLTALAPNVAGWDQRRASTKIHWVDGLWSVPLPAKATAGTVHPLTTLVKSATDDGGVADWKVKYTIVGGSPAEFAPTGSQTAEATTDGSGMATAQLRQPAGKFEPGKTQIRVDITRPAVYGERDLLVESGLTCVTWSAPALRIKAIGPKEASINEPFDYRIEVSNPGDQVARDVTVRTDDFPADVTFISSSPKPTQYGRNYEWKLGDIAPGASPQIINVQLKSNATERHPICFSVASATDELQTKACAETDIVAPCIGLAVDGPDRANVGETIAYNIQIVNQCDEDLENVALNVQFDPQLDAIDLGRVIEANIGTLRFGESKTVPLQFKVTDSGTPCFYLKIAADGGHSARAKQCVEVEQSSARKASMQLDGMKLIEVGPRAAIVRARIRNSGPVRLDGLRLTNRFSPSLEPKDITDAYKHRHNWITEKDLGISVGTLEPGQETTVEIVYDALRPDGNAFAEFALHSPDGIAVEDRFDIRIDADSGFNSPPRNGIPSPTVPTHPGQPRQPGSSIQIPADPAGNLSVEVQALDRSVRISQRGVTGAPTARFLVRIVNNRSTSDENVDIVLFVPPGLWLYDLDSGPSRLPITSQNADYTQFMLERRRELRPGEAIEFTATIAGDRIGQGTFEVQVTSDRTVSTISDRAAIEITP